MCLHQGLYRAAPDRFLNGCAAFLNNSCLRVARTPEIRYGSCLIAPVSGYLGEPGTAMPVGLLTDAAYTIMWIINAIGATVVVLAVVSGLYPFIRYLLRLGPVPTPNDVRSRLGRGLVLGLEIFIAADLLRSVLAPSLTDVIILFLITLIRIALSFSLEYEMRR